MSEKKIGVVGDIHAKMFDTKYHTAEAMVLGITEISRRVDAIVLCGDLTDSGTPEEARALARIIKEGNQGNVPVLSVLGNHDTRHGQERRVIEILQAEGGVTMIQGISYQLNSKKAVTGVMGYHGGFEESGLSQGSDDERKLMSELSDLENGIDAVHGNAIVALHYAPIETTVGCDDPHMRRLFGSSRLEHLINRYKSSVRGVIHGHAHRGREYGKTRVGIDVYNVAMPVLQKVTRDMFKILSF